LFLRDGGKVEGEILREGDGEIEVKLAHGTLVVKRADVQRIERKPTREQELRARRAKLEPGDAKGRLELARFALEAKLLAPAGELALEAFEIAPDEDAVALLKELEYHYDPLSERWIEPEKWYPSRGYVRTGRPGRRFVTVEEAAHQDAQAKTRAARTALLQEESKEKTASRTLAGAEKEEREAREAITLLEVERRSLESRKAQTRRELDRLEADLKAASEKTVEARRTLEMLVLARSLDAKRTMEPTRIPVAEAALRRAEMEEKRCRDARDQARDDLRELETHESKTAAKLTKARTHAAGTKKRAEAARTELARIRAAIAKGKADLGQLEGLEREAKDAAAKRRELEAKAEAERDEALRKKLVK
jgi:hypothetical protein